MTGSGGHDNVWLDPGSEQHGLDGVGVQLFPPARPTVGRWACSVVPATTGCLLPPLGLWPHAPSSARRPAHHSAVKTPLLAPARPSVHMARPALTLKFR